VPPKLPRNRQGAALDEEGMEARPSLENRAFSAADSGALARRVWAVKVAGEFCQGVVRDGFPMFTGLFDGPDVNGAVGRTDSRWPIALRSSSGPAPRPTTNWTTRLKL
jgi:hypothetical protein